MSKATAIRIVIALLVFPAVLVASDLPTASVGDVRSGLEQGEGTFVLIDVRSSQRFDFKHIQGAINVPAFAIADKALPSTTTIVLYDDGLGSTDCERAATALLQKGFSDVRVLAGGLNAWDAEKHPVVVPTGRLARPLIEPISTADLDRMIGASRSMTLLDLRPAVSFANGRVPSSQNLANHGQLKARTAGLKPDDLIVLYDDGSGVAEKQAEALRRQGFRAVRYLYGGMPAWRQKGLRTEK
jgi:rhodanese-related sulfurtransferase